MKSSKLYIENFMCYENGYIDFSKFNSAVVIGNKEDNELYANGVGKSTLFKAIEYVLFNQSDDNLEKIIRDNTNYCKVVFDFFAENQEYRVSRKRTKKGISDLTLLHRNSNVGSENEIYHTIKYDPINSDKFWKDISGRRAADTEKELEKLIKINFKSFRNIVHFVQNDFSGLTTSAPEKRKLLFKDALNLIIYSKLEKITKDESILLLKEIDKCNTLIDNFTDINCDITTLQDKLSEIDASLLNCNKNSIDITNKISSINNELNDLQSRHEQLENKYINLIEMQKIYLIDKDKLNKSCNDYKNKKLLLIKSAKEIIGEIKVLNESVDNLNKIDYLQIEILNDNINNIKEKLAHFNIIIQNNVSSYEELKIPVPNDNICKHCRQIMTDEHKIICKTTIDKDMKKCQENISNAKNEIYTLNLQLNDYQSKLNFLNNSKKNLEDINNKISFKNKELKDKKALCDDYQLLFDKFLVDLQSKENDLLIIDEKLSNSSLLEAQSIQKNIELKKQEADSINIIISSINKEIAHFNASKAVIVYNIDQKRKDLLKLDELKKKKEELNNKYYIYPKVIQAFSSIPDLIIQNILDDLQIKANKLLMQLKPELQLSFFIEKTKADGTPTDTLDIIYYVNGKERDYTLLSGAMKLAVTFSLKLGLSFLLQNMVGTDIKLLLLDEIDQSLDKASIDAFADIIKVLQNDFIIITITHNDRLRDKLDKFSHTILVKQDANMISRI